MKYRKRPTVEQRWERGIEHDPRSEALARALRDIDSEIGDDRMDLRFGGDGDNGEHLMYLLDDYFARQGSAVVLPNATAPQSKTQEGT